MTLKDGSGYIWVFASESATVYIFRRSREGDFLPKMLKDFKGVMVTDFYSAYDGLLVCTGAGHDAVVAASRVASPGLRVRANLLNNLNVIRVVQSLPKDPFRAYRAGIKKEAVPQPLRALLTSSDLPDGLARRIPVQPSAKKKSLREYPKLNL